MYSFKDKFYEPLIYNNPFKQWLLPGWYQGQLIHFLDLGEVDLNPSELNCVNNVFIFIRGFDVEGIPILLPYQYHIFDSIPFCGNYTSFRKVYLVQADQTYSPNTFTSVEEIKDSTFKTIETDMILNLPIL